MDSKLVQQHDDVYAAVFSLVGQKPNETYEGLVKVLPSIKDADPAEVKELEAKKALREMLKPQVDPLRLEYEKAAAEDDVDDLSTEEGDWLGVSKTDEELDENGIPMMKLSRASSSFILYGPGDVKVDNFTPEGNELDDGNGNHDGATDSGPAAIASASKPTDSGGAAAASSAPAAAAAAGYVPSVIARSRRSASGAGAAAAAPATAAPAARAVGTVMTLEDEIRAMRGAAAGAGTCAGAPPSAAAAAAAADPSSRQGQEQEGGAAEPGRRRVARTSVNEDVDEDAAEVVSEPPGALLLRAPGSGPAPVNGGAGEGRVSVAVTTAAAAAAAACAVAAPLGGQGLVPVPSGAEGQVDLPGTCLDTRQEDSLWAAMQGVDGRALLEHLGLAGPPSATVEDITPVSSAEQQDPGRADGEAKEGGGGGGGAAVVPQAAPPALANGHHVDEGAAAVGGAVARRSGSVSGGPGGGDGEGATEAAGASAAGDDAVAATAAAGGEVALVAAGGAGCRPAPAAAVVASRSGAPPSSSSADEPTFEEVESFKLDPDFDYDNVQLTVREFPYSMMGVRVPR